MVCNLLQRDSLKSVIRILIYSLDISCRVPSYTSPEILTSPFPCHLDMENWRYVWYMNEYIYQSQDFIIFHFIKDIWIPDILPSSKKVYFGGSNLT